VRILQICHKPPFPDVDGGTKAEKLLTKLLIEAGNVVDIFTIATEKHPFKENELPNWFTKQGSIEFCTIKSMPSKIGAVKSLLEKESYILSRFKNSELIEKLFNIDYYNYDLIVFDGLASALFMEEIKIKSGLKVVLRTHNLEFKVWENLQKEVKNPIKSSYFSVQSSKLKKQELNLFKIADSIWHLNKDEIHDFPDEFKPKVHFLPIVVELNQKTKASSSDSFSVGFLGAANWQPNAEAIKFIQSELANSLREIEIETLIAGRFQTNEMLQYKNLINFGEVSKIEDFFNSIEVFVNPIFSGSGLRVKIIDAVEFMVPIVSSKKGVEGLGLIPNKDYLNAENKLEFIDKIKDLKTNPDKGKQMAKSAFESLNNQFGLKNNISVINNLLTL
jgi:hypothetical protein